MPRGLRSSLGRGGVLIAALERPAVRGLWGYVKSRSSQSFTSEVKDFIAPASLSFANCQT